MYVLINGSDSNSKNNGHFTQINFEKIKKIAEDVLITDYNLIPNETTLLFSGNPGVDLVNIYLAGKYGYATECHFSCKYDRETGLFEDENLMLKHHEFLKSTSIDGLKIINEFIKSRNPKIIIHNNNIKKTKAVKNLCKYLLSFTWMKDDVFYHLVNENKSDNDIISIWQKSDIIQRQHYSINSPINNDISKKYDLITRNLQEILGEKEIMPILRKRNMNVYWGTAPTSSPSIAYLYPLLKIADLCDANCNVTILIANLHAFLDNMKSPLEKIEARSKYYIEILKSILEIYGIDTTKIKFVLGTDFQLNSNYTMDVYKYGNMTTITEAKRAGTEVVKQTENPLMTSLLYPLLQTLDEEYLNVDMALTGNDQRKINTMSRDNMQKLGYKKRVHLMNHIIPGLSCVKTNGELTKMSSSDANGKIDVLDTEKNIRKKVNKAWCVEGDIIDNSVLKLIDNLIFKILCRLNKPFEINRDEKYGGKLSYNDFKTLEKDFEDKKIYPEDLKLGFADFLINLLAPIRNKFNSQELTELKNKAYN